MKPKKKHPWRTKTAKDWNNIKKKIKQENDSLLGKRIVLNGSKDQNPQPPKAKDLL